MNVLVSSVPSPPRQVEMRWTHTGEPARLLDWLAIPHTPAASSISELEIAPLCACLYLNHILEINSQRRCVDVVCHFQCECCCSVAVGAFALGPSHWAHLRLHHLHGSGERWGLPLIFSSLVSGATQGRQWVWLGPCLLALPLGGIHVYHSGLRDVSFSCTFVTVIERPANPHMSEMLSPASNSFLLC